MKNELQIGPITRFFWWCSGAEIHILKHLPTEKNKYIGIGGAIFGTWILATISGGYAFHITFKDSYLFIFLGLIWGLMIFNLDRYITASMKKKSRELREYFLYERVFHFMMEFLPAIPRIFIALVIGMTISKPVELKLFESEITERMNIHHEKSLEEKREFLKFYDREIERVKSETQVLKSDLNKQWKEKKKSLESYDKDISQIQFEIEYLKNDLDSKWKDVNRLRNAFNMEIVGKGGSETRGYGSIARKLEKQFQMTEKRYIKSELQINADIRIKKNETERLRIEKNEAYQALREWHAESDIRLNSQIEMKNKEIERFRHKKESDLKEFKSRLSDGLLIKIKVLSDLTAEHTTMKWANILIIFLICLVETAPILVKLISDRGPYEAKLEYINKSIMIDSERKIKVLKLRRARKW